MQKRKAKDRVHPSMHEIELETITLAMFTLKRAVDAQVQKCYESAHSTSDQIMKAHYQSMASGLSSQSRSIDRIIKQL